jgi:hypothetical protein
MTPRELGAQNGRADFRLGIFSEYVWFSVNSLDWYTREYSRGYRVAWIAARIEVIGYY